MFPPVVYLSLYPRLRWEPRMMDSQKVVFPVEAGIQTLRNPIKTLDSLFKGMTEIEFLATFYELVKKD